MSTASFAREIWLPDFRRLATKTTDIAEVFAEVKIGKNSINVEITLPTLTGLIFGKCGVF